MKNFAATAFAGVLCVSTVNAYSSHAKAHISEIKNHFEKTYGTGLVGLYDKNGGIPNHHFGAVQRVPDTHTYTGYKTVGGVQFKSQDTSAILYGLTNGFQYKGLEKAGGAIASGSLVESNCFYAMHGLLESVKQLNFDMGVKKEMVDGVETTSMNIVDDSGEVKWFNMVLYNPLHIVNNVSVGYEMCDVYTQFERLSGLFSMDWALLGSYVATDLTYFLTPEGSDKLKEITELVGCDGLSDAIGGIAKTVDAATKVVDGAPKE